MALEPEPAAPPAEQPALVRPAQPGDGAPPGSRRHTIVRNSAYSLFSQVCSGAFTAALTLFLVRNLKPAQFGDFSLAVGLGALVATPADFGVSSATARFVAEHREDPQRVAAYLADGVRLKLILSALACGTLAALAGPIAAAYHAPLEWPVRLVAIAILGQNLMFLFESAFVAVGDVPKYVQVIIGESAMETGSSIAIVLLGGGLIGATAGRALGYAAGALLAMVISARRFCWTSVQRGPRRPPLTRSIMGNAAPIMLVDGANAVFTMIDILLIGAFLGSRDAGLFSAPTRLLVVFFYPALAISNGIGPRLARIGGRDPDASSLAIGIRGLILFYSLLLAPLVIWARPIVHLLLGSGYGGSVATMRILAITVLLGGLAPLVSVSANYLGEVRMRVPLMIGATLLDAAIDVVLIPRIGIVSGAIATAAAYALMVGGHIAICRRHIDLPLRRMAMSTLRAVVAAVAMGGVLAAIGSDPSIPLGVAGLVAGTAVYAVALIGLGEFSGSELAVARRRLRV